jgi:hypothetical protein
VERHHRREFTEQELENSNTTTDFDSDEPNVEQSLDRDHLRRRVVFSRYLYVSVARTSRYLFSLHFQCIF